MKGMRSKVKYYDIVVIGGGLSGMCAAIAAARHGAKVALVQSRSVFGGNASSEIRMHIVGAGCHMAKQSNSETGILMELLLENKHRNPHHTFSVWDSVTWEKVRFQENLDSYLNTTAGEVEMNGMQIRAIMCYQESTETSYRLEAGIFIDATGHGTIGSMAGAESRIGSESRAEFNEPSAPVEANSYTMGNSLMFQAVDRGEPVPFVKPKWAYTFTEDDLKYRPHVNRTYSSGQKGFFEEFHEGAMENLPEFSRMDSGYWWIELGGDWKDIISGGEEIRDELLRCVYGVWDHLKNGGDHGAENYDLEWVGMVPGYRESRRLLGDYILTEQDVRDNRIFDDAVAYGGWPMDIHIPDGIFAYDEHPSKVCNFDGVYTIPYRCFYSKNIPNLMMAGRNISTSKMAFSSTRVMGTCAIGGQAVGTAAALAIRHGCLPCQMGEHITELQQTLMKDDCWIPGYHATDLACAGTASASSFLNGCEPENVLNGTTRSMGKVLNYWESKPVSSEGEELIVILPKAAPIREIQLVFDPNLTREIMPSVTAQVKERQVKTMPEELVKDYLLDIFNGNEKVWSLQVSDNYQRLNQVCFPEPIMANRLVLRVLSTHGLPGARVFEVQIY